ncbi:sensor histidine kinase [Lachnospiraceae bacterium 54-53]
MHFKKISTKIFIGVFVLSTFFLVLSLTFINSTFYRELKKNEIQNNLLASNKIRSQFDLIINLIQATSAYLYENEEIRAYLSEGDPRSAAKISENLNNILEMQPFLSHIHLVRARDSVLSTSRETGSGPVPEYYEKYLDKDWSASTEGEWISVRDQDAAGYQNDKKIISFIRPVMDPDHELTGLLIMDLNYNYIQEMFMLNTILSNEKTLVINSGGEILFNFPYYTSYEPVLRQYPQLLDTSTSYSLEGKVFQLDSTIVSNPIKIADWSIIRIMQTQHLIKNTQKLTGYAVAIITVSCITSLIYGFWLTDRITRPIKVLSDACNRIKGGDFSLRVQLDSRDEVGNLGVTFNLMLDKLNSYFENELQEQRRKSTLEFKVLQSQINPHFLYNTLDSIRWLATMQNITNVAEMTGDLTNLLKYNLKQDTTSALLKDEIESIRRYIGIQKYRYGNYFEVDYQIPEETLHCVIIPFCIQPLIENSIIHGFDDVEKNNRIRIESYIEGGKLCVKITDNGSGMDQSVLEQVNSSKVKSNKFNQIGIKNIKERIQMQHGPEYGLTYVSGPEAGTVVTITFPYCTAASDHG